MKYLIVTINANTRKPKLTKNFLGINGENLQGNIIVDFEDEFIDGTCYLEVDDGNEKYLITMEKVESHYILPIKSSLLKTVGKLSCQIRISSSVNEDVSIFKSEVFEILVLEAINAAETIPEQYPTFVDEITARVENLEDNKQNKLIAGDNITLQENADGTTTINADSGLATVDSVNGKTGVVVLNADDLDDTNTTNKFVTETEKLKIANAVQKTGDEDIYGLKTFDVRPKVGIEQELPSAYSKLDYIQSTNGQYIDVGYYPNNIKKSQIKFSFDSVSGEQWLLGMQASVGGALSHTGGQAFVMLQSGVLKYKIWGYDTSTSAFVTEHTYSTNLTAEADTIYEVETMMISQSQYMKVDGNTLATSSVYRDGNASKNAYLFKGNTVGNPAYIKLYECKLYDYSDNLIRDYVPCKRITDNAIGLYDFVSETFYASASTSFIAGPETIPSDNDRVMLKGDIEANPTLDGTESELDSINIKGTNYKIPQGQIIQVDTMPSASASNNGQIVQYIGTTTLTYTNGYFYKSNGTSWDNINVQPSSGGGSGITNYEVIDRVNSIPTASATSPDFIQVAGINYAKKRTIDLSNTTWLLNNTPTLLTGDPIFNINFTSNSSNFNVFYFITTTGNTDLFYAETGLTNIVHAYSEQSASWVDGDSYKTIAITGGNDANNEALYNWLIENATLQSGTVVGYEYALLSGGLQMDLLWENSDRGSAFAGQTLTINNLKQYKFILIYANGTTWTTSNEGGASILIPTIGITDVTSGTGSTNARGTLISYTTTNGYQSRRNVYLLNNSVVFSNATSSGNLGNEGCIPMYIYGIK